MTKVSDEFFIYYSIIILTHSIDHFNLKALSDNFQEKEYTKIAEIVVNWSLIYIINMINTGTQHD